MDDPAQRTPGERAAAWAIRRKALHQNLPAASNLRVRPGHMIKVSEHVAREGYLSDRRDRDLRFAESSE